LFSLPYACNRWICAQHHLRARFATENCEPALADFERHFPVSFALELEQLYEDKPGEGVAAARARLGVRPASAGARPGAAATARPPPPLPIAVRLGMRKNPAAGTGSSASLRFLVITAGFSC